MPRRRIPCARAGLSAGGGALRPAYGVPGVFVCACVCICVLVCVQFCECMHWCVCEHECVSPMVGACATSTCTSAACVRIPGAAFYFNISLLEHLFPCAAGKYVLPVTRVAGTANAGV